MNQEKNPPAFARTSECVGGMVECREQAGMSLRDYFAAAILSGSGVSAKGICEMSNDTTDRFLREFAKGAYRLADIMLEERLIDRTKTGAKSSETSEAARDLVASYERGEIDKQELSEFLCERLGVEEAACVLDRLPAPRKPNPAETNWETPEQE